ncbi:TetR/AcrR family transcriptional regulator [Rhodococcus pyridinivorans]|uniref:TetR/AcrR family transcriptional regulator n=1 Tax=Rhodococcus pyridinivorans TaxID=103816 RepID=UPI0009BE0A28|nr:TetR/AcrR family transcriptional regulator [Rhodococcus pyridinivorans]
MAVAQTSSTDEPSLGFRQRAGQEKVRRSIAKLIKGLEQVAKEPSEEIITVREICEAADISTVTFYKRFSSVDLIIIEFIKRYVDPLCEESSIDLSLDQTVIKVKVIIHELVEIVNKYKRLFNGPIHSATMEALGRPLAQIINDAELEDSYGRSLNGELLAEGYVSALVVLARRDDQLDELELEELLTEMVIPRLRQAHKPGSANYVRDEIAPPLYRGSFDPFGLRSPYNLD